MIKTITLEKTAAAGISLPARTSFSRRVLIISFKLFQLARKCFFRQLYVANFVKELLTVRESPFYELCFKPCGFAFCHEVLYSCRRVGEHIFLDRCNGFFLRAYILIRVNDAVLIDIERYYLDAWNRLSCLHVEGVVIVVIP